ncbi:DUF2934 domain-containing protein [Flaviflagellibacter deserti]|uniref:DUF2934 domain-containing protein n=1 Tax=Flaviflagellibacter deserti TaxID=2267266 RepID=A0ABV9YZG2_9HYPH
MEEFYETQGGTTDSPGTVRLWRFTPLAKDDDGRWLGGPIWSEVIVRAETSGQAIQLASDWETETLRRELAVDIPKSVLMDRGSALADPALYQIEELRDPEPHGGLGVIGHGEPRAPIEDPTLQSKNADRDNEDELIGIRAYQIWVAEGEPEGREEEHWRRACEELAAGHPVRK